MNLGKRETAESVETMDSIIKIINPKNRLDETTRGSPSLVNGARLRTSSLRGSWVRIPPPALHLALRIGLADSIALRQDRLDKIEKENTELRSIVRRLNEAA